MILLVTSGMTCAILLRGKAYEDPLSKWTVVGFEFLFAWICALSLMFSPEYMHRSYDIADRMGQAVCYLTGTMALFGFILICYSLYWQVKFNMARIENMRKAIELAAQRAAAKKHA